MARVPDCHPDRKHSSRGLCKSCYNRRYRESHRDELAVRKHEWYEATKEAKRARKKAVYEAWYATNAEKDRASGRAWYAANKGRRSITQRAWYLANRERLAAKRSEYRESNRERLAADNRAYYAANRESCYRRVNKRRARKLGNGVEDYDRNDIFERDDWICQICGEPVDPQLVWPDMMRKSIDHIIPIARGGPDTAENVQLAHLRCNLRKGAREVRAA